MTQQVEVPGLGIVEFPDDMSTAQMEAAIQSHLNQSQAPQKNPVENLKSYAKSYGTGFETGLERGVHGYVQPLAEGDKGATRELMDRVGYANPIMGLAGNLVSNALPQDSINNFDQSVKQSSIDIANARNKRYQDAAAENPTIAALGDFTGNLTAQLPAFLMTPGGKLSAAKQALLFAGQNALSASGNYVEGNDSGQRLMNMGLAGAFGFAAPFALKPAEFVGGILDDAFKNGIGAAYNNTLQKIVAPKVFAGVDPAVALPVKEAADRIGFSITPAEASGSNLAYATQGRAGYTHQAAIEKQAFANTRLKQERDIINNMKERISPSNPTNSVNDFGYSEPAPLYQNANATKIPSKQFQGIISDPVIAKYWNAATKDPLNAADLAKYGNNSFASLDMTKQGIDDAISSASNKGLSNKVRKLEQSRKQLVSTMDSLSTDYPVARQMAQRDIVRRNIEEDLNNQQAGATQFYKRELAGDKEFNDLVRSTKNVPGMTQDLNDMRSSFTDLFNQRKGSNAGQLALSSLDVPRSSPEWYMKLLGKITGGQLDKATVRLINNPQWDKQLIALNAIKDMNQRNLALANLLSKAASSDYTAPESP